MTKKSDSLEVKLRGRLSAALDALVMAAIPHEGLFPSILDRRAGVMPETLPPPIPGQRNGDRAYPGSNLIHDEATLKTLYALARAWNCPDYAAAANRCLQRFAIHCTATATGLFPWGEHSFWHLTEDRVGNSYVHYARYATMGQHLPATHDHLRQAPLWLWEKLWEFNPDCVERFAEGLDFHWQEGKRDEYIRHANIERRVHPTPGGRSCDFPRHGGFYIFDWAFAWSRTGREDFLGQICDMLDYWWLKRDTRGLLLIESRCPPGNDPDFSDINAPGQTISLAASLLEAAELLESGHPALANTMRARAAVYVDGFLDAPPRPRKGRVRHLLQAKRQQRGQGHADLGERIRGLACIIYCPHLPLRASPDP